MIKKNGRRLNFSSPVIFFWSWFLHNNPSFPFGMVRVRQQDQLIAVLVHSHDVTGFDRNGATNAPYTRLYHFDVLLWKLEELEYICMPSQEIRQIKISRYRYDIATRELFENINLWTFRFFLHFLLLFSANVIFLCKNCSNATNIH